MLSGLVCRSFYYLAIEVKTASRWARWAAGVTGVLVSAVVLWPGMRNLDLGDDSFPSERDEVTVTETQAPDGGMTVETVTKTAHITWVDRVLGGAGVILLSRIALTALAAFVAGGLVQRALLGRFAFKAGGIELPEIAELAAESKNAVAKVQAQVEVQQQMIDELQATIEEIAQPIARVGVPDEGQDG